MDILIYTPNVTRLDISNNNISDITYLQSLPNLEYLNLNNNDVSYMSVLKYLPALNTLYATDNNISDLLPLKHLVNLTALNLSNNSINDLLPLENLTNLVYLNLSSNNISDITYLQNLVNLTDLILSSNPVSTFSLSIASVTNKITDISILANFSKLKRLDISGNAISDLSPLEYLYNLTDLNALDQEIIHDSIESIGLGEYFLDLYFLKDVDESTPCIDYMSDGGFCFNSDSCDCSVIEWIYDGDINKEVYFDFSSEINKFSGVVKVTLLATI